MPILILRAAKLVDTALAAGETASPEQIKAVQKAWLDLDLVHGEHSEGEDKALFVELSRNATGMPLGTLDALALQHEQLGKNIQALRHAVQRLIAAFHGHRKVTHPELRCSWLTRFADCGSGSCRLASSTRS